MDRADDDRMDTARTPRVWSAESQRALMALVFPARQVTIVAIAVIVPFVPALRGSRWAVVALLLLVLLPLDLGFAAWSRRHGRFPMVLPIFNMGVGLLVVSISPATFPAVAISWLGDVALSAVIFGRRYAMAITALGTVLLTSLAFAVDVADAGIVISAIALGGVSTAWYIGNVGEWERATGERFAELVGEVDVIVWEMLPGSDRFSYVSPAATTLLGYPIEDWYAYRFWVEHVHPDDVERVLAEIASAVDLGLDHTLEYRMVDIDGRTVHMRDVTSLEVDTAGKVVQMRGVILDISDRRRAEEVLREEATHDPLTGLANRALMADRLEQALREARRTGDSVALLVLDLDDFKEVNDALGHDTGDHLLTAFATRLRNEVRECDVIARLGGDEFGLLLTTDADARGATAVANRVLALADRPFDIAGLNLQTRASIGVALFPDHAADAASLSAKADVAMYIAKRSGHGAALYEPELDNSSVRRLSLLGQLREAIAAEQLELQFQPCFDLRTGQVVSVEALVRWAHPVHGQIGPEEFIRLAEMSGLIRPLSRWVIGRAVEIVSTLPVALQLSANLSVRNLAEPDLVAWLRTLVAEQQLNPGRLVLEITETEVVADVAASTTVLNQIAELGIGLAVDDFGAGRSALAYLRSLPVDELKLDRCLVEGVGSDDAAAAICAAIVDLAHRLDLRVVAEGASDEHDVAALQRMGCDRAQGHFLAVPLGVDDLSTLPSLTVGDAGRHVDEPVVEANGTFGAGTSPR